MVTRHTAVWTTPSPFWPPSAEAAGPEYYRAFRQPAILRFTTDAFMDGFLAVLANNPPQLADYQAQGEAWDRPAQDPKAVQRAPGMIRALNRARLARERRLAPATSAVALRDDDGQPLPLKLYQPAHQRYYLIAASLVCAVAGLPDRHVEAPRERVSFVVRRFDASGAEYAFVEKTWRKVTQPLEDGEESLPLFAVTYRDAAERRRRIFAGMIPVARHDEYLGAADAAAPAETVDPRLALFKARVTGPWQTLLDTAADTRARLAPDPNFSGGGGDTSKMIAQARNQIQSVSWYILLDFADLIARCLPAIDHALAKDEPLDGPDGALLGSLDTLGLRSPLKNIRKWAKNLEQAKVQYPAAIEGGWPAVNFAFANPQSASLDVAIPADFEDLLLASLKQAAPPDDVPPAPAASRPSVETGAPAWFAIRCVFHHPDCGPLAPTAVSEPSARFQLAGFFDPAAPSRPIRISLPIDTSAAGLRKFDKNTSFVASDVLCGQMKALGGLSLGDLVRSVLPFPLHKDLDGLDTSPCQGASGARQGTVCSLSIPIITICALILLMIIVKLLDFVFQWLPFFKICFPIPGLKAKE